MQTFKNWQMIHFVISIYRQEVKKHQGKAGVVCGLSLVGVYQGYVSHVLECPGEEYAQKIVVMGFLL